jgi:hypothetical protein
MQRSVAVERRIDQQGHSDQARQQSGGEAIRDRGEEGKPNPDLNCGQDETGESA